MLRLIITFIFKGTISITEELPEETHSRSDFESVDDFSEENYLNAQNLGMLMYIQPKTNC